MFSDNLKRWIYLYVKDNYPGDTEQDIILFEKGLQLRATDEKLEGINELLPEALEEMCNANYEQTLANMERFIKIEQYFRHLFSVLFPERYRKRPCDEDPQSTFTSWTFAPLLKQAFGVVPEEINLNSGYPRIDFPNREAYLLVYKARNNNAHDYELMPPLEVYEIIRACLTVYLDISGRLSEQIRQKYDQEDISEEFSAVQFCKRILRDYRKKNKEGFNYVDIKWKSTGSGKTELSTVSTILQNNISRQIKLLGEAGCGKTTIMKEMEYLCARQYVNHEKNTVPVYIELGAIETSYEIRFDMVSMIGKAMGISIDQVEKMLSLNMLCLFLDGFNEILDIKAKKRVAWSIDDLVRKYSGLTVFLSDRALVQSSIDTMKEALIYKLYPLDEELKRKFIELNCNDAEIRQLLLQFFQTNPKELGKYDTPIRLSQLIEISVKTQEIPEDIDAEYIRYLFDRERTEKNDETVDCLLPIACALAVAKEEEMPWYVAEACVAKCKYRLGYSADSRKCLRLLVEMGIMDIEEGVVRFKYPSYRDYFWVTAYDTHLVDVLSEE